MPALTYEPIATTTVSSTSSVVFSSIPTTYTDLILTMSVQGSASIGTTIRYNNDSTNSYSKGALYAQSTNVSSFTESNQTAFNAVNLLVSSRWVTANHYIFNYQNTNMWKSGLIFRAEAENLTEIDSTLWRSTSAVNRIDINTTSSTFTNGIFTLYGIKAE